MHSPPHRLDSFSTAQKDFFGGFLTVAVVALVFVVGVAGNTFGVLVIY